MLEVNRIILAGKCDSDPVVMINVPDQARLVLNVENEKVPVILKGKEMVSNCQKYIRKDLSLMIEGKLVTNEDGMYVLASNVVFMESNVNP